MNRRFVSIYFPHLNDLEKLQTLCLQGKRYTPLTALDEPNAISLDVTGCAHLFGDERKMLESIRHRWHKLDAQVAMGPTPKSAKALALFKPNSIIAAKDLPYALYQLPIEAMELPDNHVEILHQLGIKTIKEFLRLPRTQLFKRFGHNILGHIDELLGAKSDPIAALPESTRWFLERHLMETIRDTDYLCIAIEMMVSELCAQLQDKALGLTQLALTLIHLDRHNSVFHVGTSKPSHDVKKLMRLIALKLEKNFNAGLGIESIQIEAMQTKLVEEHQIRLEHDEENNEHDLSFLLDALTNRLGDDKIFRLLPRESHIPERAVEKLKAPPSPDFGKPKSPSPASGRGVLSSRPVRLLAQPEPLDVIAMLPDAPPRRISWRNKYVLNIVKADGPERIENEWWQDDHAEARDYYCVEDAKGLRLWVFKQGMPPKWYLHGVFA